MSSWLTSLSGSQDLPLRENEVAVSVPTAEVDLPLNSAGLLPRRYTGEMKELIALLTFMLSLPAYADFTGKVVHVADGNTISVLKEQESLKIVIAGIDAPENKQPFGNIAKKQLAYMLAGKEVRVEEKRKDAYGRTIARVWAASDDCRSRDCPATVDVGLVLLAQGLAWFYKEHAPELGVTEQRQYTSAEEGARNGRVGLWHDPEPVPPWVWRIQ
jgi:endonuclease YncB( thermonuclease family)